MATVGVPWGLGAGSVLLYFAKISPKSLLLSCLRGALSFLAHDEPLNLSLSPG